MQERTQMAAQNLADLPLDIYTVIFGLLDPMDLMAIEQSCKALHSVCSLHTIWAEALRRTISRNHIFGPTFTFRHSGDATDSMTLQELQHASTAPARFLKLLEGKQRKKCYKNRKLWPLYTTTVPLFPEDTFRFTFLVPGGRYVVTTSDQRVMVIDLERFFAFSCTLRSNLTTEDESIDPTQYVAYHLFSNAGPLSVAPSPDGSKLRIIVSRDSSEVDNLLICEYDPSIHQLSVLRLVSLDIIRTSWGAVTPHLTSTLFALFDKNVVYVSNLVHGTYSSWDVDPALQFNSIFIAGNKIVLTGYQTARVWDIPPSLSAPSCHSQEYQSQNSPLRVHVPRIIHPPSHILSAITAASVFPTEAYHPSHRFMFMDGWYSENHESLVFDILEYPSAKDWKDLAFRQRIYLPDASPSETSGGGQEQVGHIGLVGCYNLMDSGYMYWKDHRISESRIVSSWVYGEIMYILATPGPGQLPCRPDISSSELSPENGKGAHPQTDKRDTDLSAAVEIGGMDRANEELEETSFDPTSGRCCVLASSQGSLLVQDFLRLPQSVTEKRHCGTRITDDGFKFGWEEVDKTDEQLGNERADRDLFEDVTDDERYYDNRSSLTRPK